MAVETKIPPSKQIRNFLFVIGGGALLGLVIVIALVQFYGPSGYYVAKNVLMAPDVLEKMWYTSANVSTGGHQSRFAFKEIEYLYFNDESKKWDTSAVSLEQYGKFYQLVASDRSTESKEAELNKNFDQTPPASILIKASTDDNSQFRVVGDVFQEVQFSIDGNHYRVQLQSEDPSDKWAYFKHGGIREKTQSLLKP